MEHGGAVIGHDRIPRLQPGHGGAGEAAFLPCTFWLADCLALAGREADARAIFDRLLAIRNDVGLLSEGYDPTARRLVGNFPQAYSHIGLINTARNLSRGPDGPASDRPG